MLNPCKILCRRQPLRRRRTNQTAVPAIAATAAAAKYGPARRSAEPVPAARTAAVSSADSRDAEASADVSVPSAAEAVVSVASEASVRPVAAVVSPLSGGETRLDTVGSGSPTAAVPVESPDTASPVRAPLPAADGSTIPDSVKAKSAGRSVI